MGILRNGRKKNEPNNEKVFYFGRDKICLNSRGLVPVILQKKEKSSTEVLCLVYMNREALDMSLASGKVFVYRRSAKRLEQLGAEKAEAVKIKSVVISKNKRSLLITVATQNGAAYLRHFENQIFPKKFVFEEN